MFDLSNVLPPARTFATPQGVAGRPSLHAEDTTYLGRLTEAEAKQLIKRNFAVTRLTDMLMHEIVNSQALGYDGSISDFVRHAVELLLDYYLSMNQFPADAAGFASDIMRRQHELRLDMERAKLRMELVDMMRVFDTEIDRARVTNDMIYIARRLEKYKDMIDNCESEVQRQQVREVLTESIATRNAVQAFHQWAHSRYRIDVGQWDDNWPDLATQWAEWYDDVTPTRRSNA